MMAALSRLRASAFSDCHFRLSLAERLDAGGAGGSGIGVGLGENVGRLCLVGGGLALGFRHHGDGHRVGLRGLARGDHVDDLVALGDLGGAGGGDLFFRRDRKGPRGLGDGLRLRLLLTLGGNDDRRVLRHDLELALHLGGAALHREVGLDLAGIASLVGFRLLVGDRKLLLDAVFRLVLQRGLLDLRRLRAHRRGLVGNVALLGQFRFALGAFDLERRLAGDQILLGDSHFGGANDLVALLLALLGDLGQRRQAVRVEEVGRVEMLDVALVELGQRHRFELEAVVLDVRADGVLHRLDEGRALLLQLLEVHGRGDRTEAVDELRFDQFAELGGVVGAVAQRLRGQRDRGTVGLDAQIKLRADVDAHAILGDQRVRAAAGHFEAQRLQVHRGGGMEDRQDDRAAVEHDFLAAEAGPHIGLVTRRPPVELCNHQADHEDGDDGYRDWYC